MEKIEGFSIRGDAGKPKGPFRQVPGGLRRKRGIQGQDLPGGFVIDEEPAFRRPQDRPAGGLRCLPQAGAGVKGDAAFPPEDHIRPQGSQTLGVGLLDGKDLHNAAGLGFQGVAGNMEGLATFFCRGGGLLLLLGAANQQEQAEHSGKQFHIIVS